MCGSRGGIWGPPPPPWKITSYMGFYRNYPLEPPPPLEKVALPLEKVGPPLKPLKMIVFFEITIGHPL